MPTKCAEASVQAAENVAKARQTALEAELNKAGISTEKVSKEMAPLAFSNIKDYLQVNEDGELEALSFENIANKKLKAVKKIKQTTKVTTAKDGTVYETRTLEYELYDKQAMLMYLMKLLDNEPAQRHEHTGEDGNPIPHKHVLDMSDEELIAIITSERATEKAKSEG